MPTARFKDLALDANDHQALADWWCAALGYARRRSPEGEALPEDWPIAIHDPSGVGPLIWVSPVAEPKTVKNRLHFDVWGEVEELLALGATLVRARDQDIVWDVMADIEGNEFCVFSPEKPTH